MRCRICVPYPPCYSVLNACLLLLTQGFINYTATDNSKYEIVYDHNPIAQIQFNRMQLRSWFDTSSLSQLLYLGLGSNAYSASGTL